MSGYRDDRDDYGRRREDEERGRRGFDDRRDRVGYYGGRGAEPLDAAYDDRFPPGRDERGARDYGGDPREYRDRDYSRNDFENEAVGQRGERYDYDPAARGRDGRRREDERREDERRGGGGLRARERGRGDYDEREGRSLWEEGREYFARRGRGRGRTSRSHVRCRDIMTRDVTVATREMTLEEVARMMRDEDTGVIPVVERVQNAPLHTGANESAANAPHAGASAATGTSSAAAPVLPVSPAPVGESPEARRINASVHGNGRLVGLVTDRDIVVRALAEGRDARATRAEEIMTAEVHTAHPNDRVIDAVRKMGDKQVRRIPIVDRDGILRGIISMADVALETDDDRELAEALEEISSGQSFWNRIFG
jgi:CBS domain-containing protein